jgi:hypothetical protein
MAQPPGIREGELLPAPPPSPPVLNRIAGMVLLAGTLGAVSVLGFATAVWGVLSPFVRMFQGTIQ